MTSGEWWFLSLYYLDDKLEMMASYSLYYLDDKWGMVVSHSFYYLDDKQ